MKQTQPEGIAVFCKSQGCKNLVAKRGRICDACYLKRPGGRKPCPKCKAIIHIKQKNCAKHMLDKKEFLVVELKKGRGSDEAVGQILRYMGFVKNDLATNGESVRGVIIALENDPKLSNALLMVPSIDFYRYKVDFQLIGNGEKGVENLS